VIDSGGGDGTLGAIVARQLAALEQEIAQATELHRRLGSMQALLAAGGEPGIDDWLGSLALMGACVQHFSAEELQRIFSQWKATEAEWPPLVKAVREAMERGVPHDALELQPLIVRWMQLAARWMNGDIDLLQRWGRMLRDTPGAPARSGIDAPLREYVDAAVQLRLALLGRYLTQDEIGKLDKTLGPQWRSLCERVEQLMRDGVPAGSPPARALATEWSALTDRLVRHDPALRAKLQHAYASEPLLQAGGPLSPAARRYLGLPTPREAALDPHTA
jgi:hypothetical protein